MNHSEWQVLVSNNGLVHGNTNEREARAVFAEYCSMVSASFGRASGETVTLMRDGEPVAEFDGKSHCGQFLRYCECRAMVARADHGEFWRRLAGTIRKAGTMPE